MTSYASAADHVPNQQELLHDTKVQCDVMNRPRLYKGHMHHGGPRSDFN